eukprot:9469270-Pyramimonas_sp.AAC.1
MQPLTKELHQSYVVGFDSKSECRAKRCLKAVANVYLNTTCFGSLLIESPTKATFKSRFEANEKRKGADVLVRAGRSPNILLRISSYHERLKAIASKDST